MGKSSSKLAIIKYFKLIPLRNLLHIRYDNIWYIFKFLKFLTVKKHIAIDHSQKRPKLLQIWLTIILATFWSSSDSFLSWVSFIALSKLPLCLNHLKLCPLMFILTWERVKSHRVQDPVNKVYDDALWYFYKLVFPRKALSGGIHHILNPIS